MNLLWTFAILLVAISFPKLCGTSSAAEPADFIVTTKQLDFPVIDTELRFTREADRIFRVRYSNSPPSPDLAMLYTGFYFCAARKLALELGYDRTALIPDPDSPQGGVAAFLKPGESPSELSDRRFANVALSPIAVLASACPIQLPSGKQ